MQFFDPSRTSGLRPLPRLIAPVRRSFNLRRAGATIRPALMNYLYRIAKFRIEALSRVAADFGACVLTRRQHRAVTARKSRSRSLFLSKPVERKAAATF